MLWRFIKLTENKQPWCNVVSLMASYKTRGVFIFGLLRLHSPLLSEDITASTSGCFVTFAETGPNRKTIPPSCNRDDYTAKRSICTLQKGHTGAKLAFDEPVPSKSRFLHTKKCLPSLQFQPYQQLRDKSQQTRVQAERSARFCAIDWKDLLHFPAETPRDCR